MFNQQIFYATLAKQVILYNKNLDINKKALPGMVRLLFLLAPSAGLEPATL
jgi:hypothetical protein